MSGQHKLKRLRHSPARQRKRLRNRANRLARREIIGDLHGDADEVAERMLDATQTELPEAEQAAFADQLRSRRGADRLPDQF